MEQIANPIEIKGRKAKNDDDYQDGDDLILGYDMTQFINKAKKKAEERIKKQQTIQIDPKSELYLQFLKFKNSQEGQKLLEEPVHQEAPIALEPSQGKEAT